MRTRTVGAATEVVENFTTGHLVAGYAGHVTRTPSAPVPGGCRVSLDTQLDGTVALYSYRTIVAIRTPDGAFAITPASYGPSTGKLLGRVRRAILARSFKVDGGTIPVTVAVPGRWGGFGPAWHPTGRETLPFVLYT